MGISPLLNFLRHATVPVQPEARSLRALKIDGPLEGCNLDDVKALERFLLSPVLEQLVHKNTTLPITETFLIRNATHLFDRLRGLGVPAPAGEARRRSFLDFLHRCPKFTCLQLHLAESRLQSVYPKID